MPNYDYFCEKCKKTFEFFQSMKDEPFKVCPKEACLKKTWGKGKVQRQLGTGAGLIFKGSGFYITDYRSESYKSAAKSDSAAGSSGDSGSKSEGSAAKSDNSSSSSGASKSDSGGKASKKKAD
jgi:putative FmdB family regulatory protein